MDLWEYGINHPVPAIFVNKSTATEYLKSLEGRAGVIPFHLESATISYDLKSVLWKRVDPRVSKEKLEVKFYMNCRSEKMSIQHSTTDSPFKYRIEISFNKFMGLKLSSGILTADVYGSPIVESKKQQAGTWKEEQSTIKNTSTRVVLVIYHQSDHHHQRVCRQIWNEYHRFVQHFVSVCAMTIHILIPLTVINLTIASHSLEIQP